MTKERATICDDVDRLLDDLCRSNNSTNAVVGLLLQHILADIRNRSTCSPTLSEYIIWGTLRNPNRAELMPDLLEIVRTNSTDPDEAVRVATARLNQDIVDLLQLLRTFIQRNATHLENPEQYIEHDLTSLSTQILSVMSCNEFLHFALQYQRVSALQLVIVNTHPTENSRRKRPHVTTRSMDPMKRS